jgi:hypothetical protein
MDVGSYFGYFGIKIAREFSHSLVWSIEGNTQAAKVQLETIKANELNNIFLCNKMVKLNDWLKLSRTVETVDVIIALSVLHEWPVEERKNILYLWSRIAPELIIEVDNLGEYEGVDYMTYLQFFYDEVQLIGKGKSVKGLDRPIYYCVNKEFVKKRLTPYLHGEGYTQAVGRRHDVKREFDNWIIDDKQVFRGVNACNLMHFGLMNRDKIINDIANEWHKIKDIGPTDISIKNSIMTASGIRLIDYTENIDAEMIYGLTRAQYREKVNNYTPEKIAKNIKSTQELNEALH